jgi:hypothetical protein
MDSFIRLENLPNELLIEILKYIDARTIYQSFYNLNYRFNILLKSLTRLYLVLWPCKNDFYDDLFASRVHTLVIYCDVIFTLSRYENVRRLVLFNSKYDQISEIMMNGTQLETISLISPRCFYTTFVFHEMIFSNKFTSLKSCYLTTVYSPSLEVRELSWNQSPSLRSLRISSKDSLIHVAILNACPNLSVLQLSVFHLDHTPVNIKPHMNLRRMKLIFDNVIWPLDEVIIETFFFSMPYLKRLSVQRSASVPETINDLLQFDWLVRVITRQLLFLQQFIFCLHLLNSHKIDQAELEKFICQIQKHFVNIYHNYQQYHLEIIRS